MSNTEQKEWHENFLKMSGIASLVSLILTAWFICLFILLDQFHSMNFMQLIIIVLAIIMIPIFLWQISISFNKTFYTPLLETATSNFQKISLVSSIVSIALITVITSSLSFVTIMKNYKKPVDQNIHSKINQ